MSPNAFPIELNIASYTLSLAAVFITIKTAGPGLNAALKEMIKNANQLEKFIIQVTLQDILYRTMGNHWRHVPQNLVAHSI